jgi:pimeloyl-ACP methyl ester carboxylesterase
MDEAGFPTAYIVGNSLGGYVVLQLAARSRAETVVALAPAGGWAEGDESFKEVLAYQKTMQDLLKPPRHTRTRSSPRRRVGAPSDEARLRELRAHTPRAARPSDEGPGELRGGGATHPVRDS